MVMMDDEDDDEDDEDDDVVVFWSSLWSPRQAKVISCGWYGRTRITASSFLSSIEPNIIVVDLLFTTTRPFLDLGRSVCHTGNNTRDTTAAKR